MHLLKLKSELCRLSPKTRLYNIQVPIIGLTGSIATGKTTVAKKFENLGAQVINADLLVKQIYQTKEALNFISTHFKNVLVDSKIDFLLLRKEVFNDDKSKTLVEEFIYPRLEKQFLQSIDSKCDFIIYDVPLLFEKNLDKRVDTNILVYCPETVQINRLVARDSIELELAKKIISNQVSIEEKRKLAEFILDNSSSLEQLDINFQQLIPQIWDTL